MWTQEASETFKTACKWYAKKRKRELEGVAKNLNTYFTALCAGTKPLQIKFGFVHTEGKGVVAFDQGGGKGLQETRLYAFPDLANEVLWLLAIGDKKTQTADIKRCHEMVTDFLKEEDTNHDSESGTADAGEEGEVREHRGDDS